jgi:hypothetical protein
MRHMIGASLSRTIWYLSLAASIAILILFTPLNAPLQTAAAPSGMISFELARTAEQAAEILRSWSPEAQLYAAFSLGLDYLFMVSYATAIGFTCLFVATRLAGPAATLGRAFAWGQLPAALLDGVENVALWQQLVHGAAGGLASLAWLAATIKFAVVGAGLLYALVGGILVWRRR